MAVNSFRKDEESSNVKKSTTLLRLFRYLLAYKRTIIVVLFIMAGTITISLINPLIMSRAIDVYVKNRDIDGLLRLGAFALVLNLILIGLVKLRMYLMSKISNHVLLTIRQELYTHMQKLSFSFFDKLPTGKILSRVIGDVNSLKNVLSNSVTTLIPDFITLITVIIIMLSINYKLALASFTSLPLLIGGLWYIETHCHMKWRLHRKKSSNLNAYVHENISGIRVIQNFHAEDEALETFDKLQHENVKSFLDAVILNDTFGPLVDICWAISTVALYYVGIKVIGVDKVSVGVLLAFTNYTKMFWQPISNLSNFYNQLITNISGAERIFEVLDTDPDIKDTNDVIQLPEINGDIRFDHVSFSYDDDVQVLNNISFHVKPGETIALVGPTGAGKTTIVNLISRFYDIQKGTITVDGYDLTKVSIESLREQMGIMTQDNFLFSGTVKDNIRYGKLDATDEEIIAAAKAVNAHDFIMKLEKGYDTELKERGSGLSVGQKQLLAFARTMVSMPKILILDEATSSIDTHTELLVQQGIESLLKGRTSFVIAHRLSTIQKADRIFVVKDGKIAESGTPKELLAQKGFYHDLYMAQFKNIA